LTLNFGINTGDVFFLVIAVVELVSKNREQVKKDVKTIVERLTKEGMKEVADFTVRGRRGFNFAKRLQSWEEFRDQFANHSAVGSD